MRILHLFDGPKSQRSNTTLALLGQSVGRLGSIEQRVLLVGGSDLPAAAQSAGLHEFDRLGAPFAQALLAWRGLQQWLKHHGPFDLIHCWSIGALTAASLLTRNTPKLCTLTRLPSPRQGHWLRLLAGENMGRVVILTISSTIRRSLLSRGITENAVHVLRPGLDLSRVDFAGRAAWRSHWGVNTEQQKVVALLSDPPWSADTFEAIKAVMLAGGVLAPADNARESNKPTPENPRLSLLIHPDQFNRARVETLARGLTRLASVIVEPALARPWSMLPGCDLALVMGPDAGGLSLLWAMAANVPIIGEATYAISEIVEDHHSALLAKPGQPPALSMRICDLLGDPALAWKLRDTARHEAYSFFSNQRYCQNLREIYEQIHQGQPVEVPPLLQTGGLKFAGRA